MYQQLKAKDDRIQEAEEAKDKAERELNEALEQLEKADECLKMLEQQASDLGPLQQENEQLQQRIQQMTSIQDSLKGDFQQILNYKNDLELLIEDQTQQMEQKNKKIFSFEDVESRHAHDVEQLESKLRVATQQGDESKKKLLQAEVKIRQLT